MKTNLYTELGHCVFASGIEIFRKTLSITLILFFGLIGVINANFTTYFEDNIVLRADCEQPVFGQLYLMPGTCLAGVPNMDATIYFKNNSNTSYGAAQLMTVDGRIDPSQREISVMAYDGNLHFGNLLPSRIYKITIFGIDEDCYSERIVETMVSDCLGTDLIVDKAGSYVPPIEAMDGERGESCGAGVVETEGCSGGTIVMQKGNLNANRYITAHGNCGPGSAILPACLAYVDDACNVTSVEYAFCFDYTKSSGLGAGYQPGTVQFIKQIGIHDIPVLNQLKAARLSWVFEHLSDYGLSMTNSTHRRALQLVSWKIINPEEQGVQDLNCSNASLARVCQGAQDLANWCDIYDAAMAAVPTGAQIPNLSMTPANSSTLISETVTIELITNEDVIELTMSDGGSMPYLCGGSQGQGHVIVDNNDGTGILTLSGSGQRIVSLCVERSSSVELTMVAEIETLISDGSSFSIYIPQEPYHETVQPFFSYTSSILRPRAEVAIEFMGDLELTCPDQLILDCYNFDPADVTAWLATIEVESDCGIKSITNNYAPNNFQEGECDQVGTQEVTFTVTDNCDQVKTCTATITVRNDREIEWISVPSDITLDCSETIPVTMATAGDNCGVVTVDYVDQVINETCPNSYTVKRTFTAEDECGNTKTHVQNIHIIDDENPVFDNIPSDITVDCSEEGYTTQITSWLNSITATDNCSTVTITNNFDPSVACGEVVVTFTGTDACGNSITLQRTVTISGSQTPEITIGTTPILNCGDQNNLTIIGNWLSSVEGTNSCGSTDVSVNYTAQEILTALVNGTFESGETCQSSLVVTFTAQDPCGSTIEIEQTITLVDEFNPTISCPGDLTLECGGNNQSLINNWLNSVVGSDNCSNVVITNNYNTSTFVSDCGNSGYRVVTFTATDQCGNEATCSATIYIEDNTAPVFTTVPSDVTLECGQSLPAPNHVVTDNCGTVNVEIDEETINGDCAYNYQVVRTYTATDDCGNIKVHVQNIYFEDSKAPVFTYVPSNYNAECGEELLYEDATATDDCGAVTISVTTEETIGSCPANKTIKRTFTAVDECGNSTQAFQYIYVEDTGLPTFTSVPADLTLTCGDVIPTVMATATDACSGVNVTYSDNVVNQGCASSTVVTRTFVATDDCGNSNTATQTITVLDVEKPYFTNVPSALNLDCTDPNIATIVTNWLNQVTASDDCSSVTVSNNYVANYNCGLYNVMHIATDACGNKDTVYTELTISGSGEFEIFIPSPPEINCGNDGNLELIQDWIDSVYAEGNCGQVQVISNKTAEEIILEMQGSLIDPKGECQLVITVEFSASDLCGIAASKQGEITLVDANAPVITCLDSLFIECGDVNMDDIIQDWIGSLEAYDFCTGVIVEHTYNVNNFTTLCGNAKSQTVIFFVHDECGNTSWCTSTIVIEDTTLPVFVNVPDDITISCELEIPLHDDIVATDNCGSALVEFVDEIFVGSCPYNYMIERTFTATDLCGNINVETRTITIVDEEKPVFTFVPQDVSFGCDDTVIKLDATATDQCGTPEIVVNETIDVQNCEGNYTITRVFTATDACGNSVDSTQIITVGDNTPPVFVNVPDNLSLDCDNPNISTLVNSWLNSATAIDECSDVIVTHDFSGDLNCGEYKVIFTATDLCGNTAKDSSYIEISGSGELEIYLPETPELICGDENNLTKIQNWIDGVYATGGCGVVQVIANKTASEVLAELEQNLIDSKGECLSIVEVDFTTSDLCGDEITYTGDLSIFDTESPVLTCPEDLYVDCGNPDLDSIIVAWLLSATATDNCTEVVIDHTFSEDAYIFGCGQTRTQEVLFIAYDICGNQSLCLAYINIVDEEGPVFTYVPEDVTLSCLDDIIY